MNAELTTALIEKVLAFILLLQGVEVLWLYRSSAMKIWSFENLKTDFYKGLPLPKRIIDFLFADKIFVWIPVLQIVFAIVIGSFPSVGAFAVLLILHLIVVLRFRGSFNGGSDMVLFVLLTGMLIVTATTQIKIQQLGLYYIAIHVGYSYFRAGYVKLISRDWQSGQAIPVFLGISLFPNIRWLAAWLKSRPMLSRFLCWSVIIFELAIVLIPFSKTFAVLYCVSAAVFHLFVFFAFGLNRFFWVWMTAWIAVLFSVQVI